MSFFTAKQGAPFDWKAFQKHRGYTDEEMEALMNNPKKKEFAQMVSSPELQNKWMIIEVVESHGCEIGMKPGDRLYFEGLQILDTKRSSPWCPHALYPISWFVHGAVSFFLQGKDPSLIYADHFGCVDSGSKYGYGRVLMKVKIVNKKDLDKLG